MTGKSAPIRSVALLTSDAFSLSNFRGPLIEALVARGIEVLALAPDHSESSRRKLTLLGARCVDIRMQRAGMNLVGDLRDVIGLKGILEELKPDAVLSYFIKPVIYGSIAARLAQVPHRFALVEGLGYVFSEHSAPANFRRALLRRFVSRLYQLGFASCKKVFFLNAEDASHFVETGAIAQQKVIRLNGIGVDLDALKPAPFSKGPVTFLLMARLLREKGIGEYVEAARIVRETDASARFVLLGAIDPNPNSFTHAEIAAFVAEGVIEWPGHVEDVRPWIAASSVYVLPSYYREGVPRSSQEALAMGRAIITTDNVGCRETVIDGVSGLLVQPRDVPALADAMLKFINEPDLIAKMGAQGRLLAEARYDVRQINAQILSTIGIAETGSTDKFKDAA